MSNENSNKYLDTSFTINIDSVSRFYLNDENSNPIEIHSDADYRLPIGIEFFKLTQGCPSLMESLGYSIINIVL